MPNTAHYITGGCQLRNWLSNCITGCPDKLKLQYIACCATGQSHFSRNSCYTCCATVQNICIIMQGTLSTKCTLTQYNI